MEQGRSGECRYRFDDVEVDAQRHRVLRGAVELALEPKAQGVLLELLRHAGEVVERDALLDSVWGHRHVTPAVLNRSIAMLRRELGDDAEHPRLIRTVHGVGYEFIGALQATVEATPAAPAPIPMMAADESVSASVEPASIAVASKPIAITTAPASATARTRLRSRDVALAALALALVGAAALVAGMRLRAPASPAVAPSSPALAQRAEPPTLVVLPLRSAADADTALAEGMSEELTTRLARIDGLALIGQTSAKLAQERKLDFVQLGQQLHVTHAIEGSLRQAGDQLRIDLRLVEVPSGKTVWAQDYDRKPSDIFAVQSEIAQAVAGALALRLGLAAAQTPASSEDVALYRQYLELRSVLLRTESTPGRPRHVAALAALREMVARAPDYARAHGLLAHYLSWWQVLGEHGRAEVEREAARALQLDPDLADAHEALAQQACKRLEWDPCIAEHRRALALDPTDVTIRADYAFHLAAVGYLEEGLSEFETAYRSDPIFPPASQYRAHVLDALGRHDAAKIAFDTVLKVTEPTYASYARWHNAVWRHDYAQAQQCVRQMPEKEGFRDSYLAVTAALQDASRWPQARKAIEESEHVTGHYNFARLLDPAGYDAQAVFAAFENMLRSDHPPAYFMLAWQPEYAALRTTPAFQDYIHRMHMLDYWRAHGFPPQCKPEGDGARCD